MEKIISADGTPIAFVRDGSGPAIVFAAGAFNDHTRLAPLAAALADDHTVVTYDRRGRGASGDGPAYAIEREIEDLAALIETVGGHAAVFGYSSGAVLALRAAADLPSIDRLLLFEPPFGARAGTDLPERMQSLIDVGRPDEAVTLFQAEGIGLAPPVIEHLRRSPMWPGLVAMAQATVYDAIITTVLAEPTPVAVPTLVMVGADTMPMLKEAAKLLVGAEHVEVEGGVNHDIPVDETARIIRTVKNP